MATVIELVLWFVMVFTLVLVVVLEEVPCSGQCGLFHWSGYWFSYHVLHDPNALFLSAALLGGCRVCRKLARNGVKANPASAVDAPLTDLFALFVRGGAPLTSVVRLNSHSC